MSRLPLEGQAEIANSSAGTPAGKFAYKVEYFDLQVY